jgi:hypothetical protein
MSIHSQDLHGNKNYGPFIKISQLLIDNGYSPVPTKYKDSKNPIEKLWNRRCDKASLSILDGNDHITSLDDCNVGVACGYGGLLAIDIDDDNWQEIYLNYIQPVFDVQMPPAKVGAKGITLYYRIEGGKYVPNTTVKDSSGKKLFEIRSYGNHTAIPPSVHPTTKQPYKWHGGTVGEPKSLLNTKLSDIPGVTLDQVEELRRADGVSSGGGYFDTDKSLPSDISPKHRKMFHDDIEEALKYIPAQCEYHDWLNVAFGMAEFFGKDDTVARSIFIRWSDTAEYEDAKTTPEKLWDGIKENSARKDKVGIGTVYMMARTIRDGESQHYPCAFYKLIETVVQKGDKALLFEPTSVEQVAVLKKYLYAEYLRFEAEVSKARLGIGDFKKEVKRKRKQLFANVEEDEETLTAADALVKLVADCPVYRTANDEALIAVKVNGYTKNYLITSSAFRDWLQGEYYEVFERGVDDREGATDQGPCRRRTSVRYQCCL